MKIQGVALLEDLFTNRKQRLVDVRLFEDTNWNFYTHVSCGQQL